MRTRAEIAEKFGFVHPFGPAEQTPQCWKTYGNRRLLHMSIILCRPCSRKSSHTSRATVPFLLHDLPQLYLANDEGRRLSYESLPNGNK